VPACANKECGPDNCGGSCGPCGIGNICNDNFECVPEPVDPDCIPDCAGKVCGEDGCGGSCAPGCKGDFTCQNGNCVENPCVPNCNGKVCGNDNCGGSCGTCKAGETCQAGQCVQPPPPPITEQTIAFQLNGKLIVNVTGQTEAVAAWAAYKFAVAKDADPDGVVRIFIEATSVPTPPLNGGFYSDHPFKVVQTWNSPYPPACDGYGDTLQHVIAWEASGPPNWPKSFWVLLFCPSGGGDDPPPGL
ncbi:MAG: hypothetical protein WC604_01520, partial [Candidatus Gracilibacteria bacterium]